MRFDKKKRRYVDSNGRVLSEREVRREVDDYVEQEKEKTKHEAAKLIAGVITVTAFFHFMKQSIEKWHEVTGAIAYGGRAQLDAEREARIAAKIQSELEYLAGFKQEVAAAEELTDSIAARAAMYANSAYATYANNVTAREFDEGVRSGRRVTEDDTAVCDECSDAEGEEGEWYPLEDIPEIGTLQCGSNCRCWIEYSDAPEFVVMPAATQQAEAVQ